MKIVSTNRKAYHDYFVEDTVEAGIVLLGSEVKSIRAGNCNLKDSFIFVDKDEELILKNMYVKPYEKASAFIPDERRDHKLLMHKNEIRRLLSKVRVKGYTLIPIQLYFKGSLVKVEVGLCRGKQNFDKKDALKEKDIKRDMDREIKNFRK
ncbi:MAG TPA: SsrA-binding protein [Clostridiales bacterium]|nr:SsrA-binding protein [Clostridiales bacterium]